MGVMEGQKGASNTAVQNSQALSALKTSPNITIIKGQATQNTNTSLSKSLYDL